MWKKMLMPKCCRLDKMPLTAGACLEDVCHVAGAEAVARKLIVSLSLLFRSSTSSHCRLSSTSTSSSSWPTTMSPIASAPSCWTMSLSEWKLVGCWTRGDQGVSVWKRSLKVKAFLPSMARHKEQGVVGCGSTWTSSTGNRPSLQTSCTALMTRNQ